MIAVALCLIAIQGMHGEYQALDEYDPRTIEINSILVLEGWPEGDRLQHLPLLDHIDLEGRRIRSGDLTIRPTVISFFARDCMPCARDVPMLNEFARRHPEYNYLAVTPDPPQEAQRFIAERRLSWRVVPAAKQFIEKSQVRSFPTLLVVTGDRRIVGRSAGARVARTGEAPPGLGFLERWVPQSLIAR